MSCGATTARLGILRGARFFGQGAGWRFRSFVAGLRCPQNLQPPAPCDVDFTPPAVAVSTVQLGPLTPFEVQLTETVTGVQTGVNSCNVRVFRQDASQVPGTVTFDGDRTITFTPSDTYCAGVGAQNVTITLGSNLVTEPLCPGILDRCGNRMPLTNLSVPVVGC